MISQPIKNNCKAPVDRKESNENFAFTLNLKRSAEIYCIPELAPHSTTSIVRMAVRLIFQVEPPPLRIDFCLSWRAGAEGKRTERGGIMIIIFIFHQKSLKIHACMFQLDSRGQLRRNFRPPPPDFASSVKYLNKPTLEKQQLPKSFILIDPSILSTSSKEISPLSPPPRPGRVNVNTNRKNNQWKRGFRVHTRER